MSVWDLYELKDNVSIVVGVSLRYNTPFSCYNCLSCKTISPKYVVLTSVHAVQHATLVRANSHIIMTHVLKL